MTLPSGPASPRTVLVVDDEAAVRTIIRLALGPEGYAVLEAASAEEALQRAGAHPGPIDLLVADVVLPDVGGRDLAGLLVAARPGLRVLYCSGHDRRTLLERGALGPGDDLLEKPFPIATLLARVREALGGPDAGPTSGEGRA